VRWRAPGDSVVGSDYGDAGREREAGRVEEEEREPPTLPSRAAHL